MLTKMRVGIPSATTLMAEPTVPVQVPSQVEIDRLARELHRTGQEYRGEWQGWPVRYEPEDPMPPLDSALTFTPATFFIGVWPLWFISYTWEDGSQAPPHISRHEKNLLPA